MSVCVCIGISFTADCRWRCCVGGQECVSTIAGTRGDFAAIKSKAPTRSAGLLRHESHIPSFSPTPRCHSRPDKVRGVDERKSSSCAETPALLPQACKAHVLRLTSFVLKSFLRMVFFFFLVEAIGNYSYPA